MNILNRIILSIYMLIMIAFFACVSIIPFKAIPYENIINIVDNLYNEWYYSLIALFFLVISIMLLLSGITRKKKVSRGIVKVAEYGDIKISVETFESLALRVVKQLPGIKDVKIKVVPEEGGIVIFAKLLVMPDISIPKMVSEAQSKIKEYIENITEIDVKEIKVEVENITQVATLKME